MKKVYLQNRKSQGILLITAGTDEWEPTQDDIEQIANLFITALSNPDNAPIIAVRQGVTAEFISVPKEWFGKGWKLIPARTMKSKRGGTLNCS